MPSYSHKSWSGRAGTSRATRPEPGSFVPARGSCAFVAWARNIILAESSGIAGESPADLERIGQELGLALVEPGAEAMTSRSQYGAWRSRLSALRQASRPPPVGARRYQAFRSRSNGVQQVTAHEIDGTAFASVTGQELVDQPLGMDPTQGVVPTRNWPASSDATTVPSSSRAAMAPALRPARRFHRIEHHLEPMMPSA